MGIFGMHSNFSTQCREYIETCEDEILLDLFITILPDISNSRYPVHVFSIHK